MLAISAISGFDKELELALLKKGIYIHYSEDALVHDEKVQRVADFRNQRTRWIAAQLNYLSTHFFSGIVHLFKGNIGYTDKIFQFMLLPRIMMLGLLSILILLLAFLQQIILTVLGSAILAILIISLYISAPKVLVRKISWKELYNLPVLFFQFMISFLQIRKARYTFIHTPHGEVKQRQH
jgi:cellulose synthase/poly-beta-1,6-N-acetylglucosamine synthase-like glycosyltransferase